MSRRLSAIFLIILATLPAACLPPEDTHDTLRRFEPDTPMGQLQAEGTLAIAVDGSFEPFVVDSRSVPEGFLVDLGTFVAEELGVEPRFSVLSSTDDVLLRVDAGVADLGLGQARLTERSLRNNVLTDPYYIAHQRLLVEEGSGIDGVEALGGRRVCSVADPATGVDIESLNPDAIVTGASSLAACSRALEQGSVEAVTGDDAVLLGIAGESGRELVGDDLTTVGYAAAVYPELTGLSAFFNEALAETKQEGQWATWYERWIAPVSHEEPEPPDLQAEEAAALWPADN